MAERQRSEDDEVQWSEDELAMVNLLKSMGVHSFDRSVPAALNEYARRYATELICDAKDYSVHSDKKEIEASDMRIAIKLSDSRLSGVDAHVVAADDLKKSINSTPLEALIGNPKFSTNYPAVVLNQRSFTFVPGSEAYSEFLTIDSSKGNNDTRMDES